jgi:hypothetical protein
LGGGLAALLTSVLTERTSTADEPESAPEAPTETDSTPPVVPARKSPKTVQSALRRAHDLFVAGNGEEAAAVLVPHLERVDEYDVSVLDKLRSLLIVIEEEHGRIRPLDKYRDRIYASRPLRSPT